VTLRPLRETECFRQPHGRRSSCTAGGRNDPLSLARRAHAATRCNLPPEQRAMNGAFYADV